MPLEVIGVMGGVQVLLTGLVGWLGKLWLGRQLANEQARLDAKLEDVKSSLAATNQRLQSALDRILHGQKLQIEKEFACLEEIWKALVALKTSALSLRPPLDAYDPSESVEKRRERRLKAFSDAWSAFGTLVETNKPFYPSQVYKKLRDLSSVAHGEAIEYHLEDKRAGGSAAYLDAATNNQAAIASGVDDVCDAIRLRVFTEAAAEAGGNS